MKTTDKTFKRLIGCFDVIKVHFETYAKSCYMKRNRYIVEQSNLVIAAYDGRGQGGTFASINYARKFDKEVKVIPVYVYQYYIFKIFTEKSLPKTIYQSF